MASRKLIIEVVGDASKLDRSLKQAKSSLRGFSKDVSRSAVSSAPGGRLGGLAIGGVGKAGVIGAGIAAGAAVASKAISVVTAKAQEAQIAQANLDQAFAASGISAKAYGKQVDAAIQSVSKMAAIDDEEVSQSFANLLRATGSVAKATRDAALAANIARARRISLAAATKIVEKAEIGQTRGLKAVGVELKKGATATDAIQAAQRKFAGAAEAYGRTAAGAQEKYRVALENVEERIGAKLLPLQTKLALAAVRFLDWADKNWPRFAAAIGDAYRTAKPYIDNLIARVKDVANVIRGVIEVIKGIANGDWSLAWKGLKKVAVAEINLIYHSFVQLPLRIAKALGATAWNAVTAAMRAAINKAIGVVNSAIKKINKAIPNFLHADIPLIPTLSTSSSGKKAANVQPRGVSYPLRGSAMAGGTVVVTPDIYVDGRKITSSVSGYQRASARRNPPQRRGPNAGIVVY